MTIRIQTIISICLAWTAFAGSASAADALSFDTFLRDDNSQDIQPVVDEDEAVLRVNRIDCEENIDFTFKISEEGSADGDLYLVVGDNCDDDDKEEGDCYFDEVSTGGTFTRNLRALLRYDSADDCSDNDGEVNVWAARIPSPLSSRDSTDELWSAELTISWDMAAPSVVEGVGAAVGENKVQISWNVDDEEDAGETVAGLDDDADILRIVYMSVEGSSADGDAGAETSTEEVSVCPTDGFQAGDAYEPDLYKEKTVTSPSSGSYDVGGLTNGYAYKLGIVTLDEYRNASVISETVCATPGETTTFLDAYREAGGKNGGFCFIATAAFGSYDHPTVRVLRKFRDQFLAPMPGGKAIIGAYYRVGPTLAAALDDRPALRSATRGMLSAFAAATVPLSALGPLLTLLLGVGIVGAVVIGVRRRRR